MHNANEITLRLAIIDDRAENAEATIARVRDVCDRIWDDARYAHKYGFLEVVREIRYALEGDSNDGPTPALDG